MDGHLPARASALGLLLLAACAGTGGALADDRALAEADWPDPTVPGTRPAPVALRFGNRTCPKSGLAIDPRSYFVYRGERVWTCNLGCALDAASDPAAWIETVYGPPRDVENRTCPVCAVPTGPNDHTMDFQGLRVRTCCDGCERDFRRDPDRYLLDLEELLDDDRDRATNR